MTAERIDYPHTDKVEAQFIKEIQERGITHALNWIDQWYTREAIAFIDDQVHQAELALPEGHWTDTHAQREFKHLVQLSVAQDYMRGRDPFKQSTSMGSTARERAMLSACLTIINRSPAKPAPVPGVVLREGQPTLINPKDIKPSDVLLTAQRQNSQSHREGRDDWVWTRIRELREKFYEASENEAETSRTSSRQAQRQS